MITFTVKSSYETDAYLRRLQSKDFKRVLDKYGKAGVDALAHATPIDSGETAASWGYTIEQTVDSVSIVWTNSNVNDGVPIAIILQYGHGTGTGGYVQGRDYINPAMRPIFDQLTEEAWKEVTE